jgi:hypothetical protein
MLKKYFFSALLITVTLKLFAQTSTELPDVLPPSPTAMQIAKFAQAGASMSTGAANVSIPLYTYATPNLQVPVSLNYSSTGLNVNQVASRVGLGWMISAGGMISRSVYGERDEAGSPAVTPTDFPNTTGSALSTYISSVLLTHHDTQPDLYNFNFGGYSGRFTLVNGIVHKLEQNNLFISGSVSAGFAIITPDGVRYDFGGPDAVESSTSDRHISPVKNAWYLKKITHPKGDEIYFKYSTSTFTYKASINQTYTYKFGEDNIPGEECNAPLPSVKTTNILTNYGVFLTGISSNSRRGGIVNLSYSPRQDLPGDYRLTLLSLFDGTGDRFNNYQYFNTTPKKSVEFYYNTITCLPGTDTSAAVSKRLFLVGLTDDDKSYTFNYKDIDLIPSRLSNSQDDYGYYNGKTNGSLVPEPMFSAILRNMFQGYGFGDRRPDAKFAQRGVLSKVIYPTGGYDSLEYEANQVYINEPPNCEQPDSTVHVMMYGKSGPHPDHREYYTNVLHVTCQQVVRVNVTCNYAGSGTPGGNPNDYLVIADLISMTTGNPINWRDQNNASLTAILGQSNIYYATLQPGDYRLKVFVGDYANGLVTFDYNNSRAINGNKDVAGIRLKRVLTYDMAGNHFNYKRYYYDTLANGRSSGILMNQAPRYAYQYVGYCHASSGGGDEGPLCIPKGFYYWKLSSANYYEANATGNNIFYAKVTESLGNNFEAGGTEHSFYIEKPSYQDSIIQYNPIPGSPLSNMGMYSGKEKQQRIFKRVGGNDITLKEIITSYTDDPRLLESTNYYVFDAYPGWVNTCNFPTTSLKDYYWLNVKQYRFYSRWQYPSSVQTITYDSNGQNPVTTVESYTYNNTSHQQLSKTQTVNSKGETFSVENFYPPDAISGLSADAASAKAELVNRHVIAPVLYQKSSKGTTSPEVLNTSRTNYFIWPDSLVLPKTIETQYKADAFEPRISFPRYDSKGNALEQQKVNGPVQAYLWDYTNAFVVAQVLNANFNEVAYTSFEADSSGNWTIPSVTRDTVTSAITGKRSYTLTSGAITRSGLSSSKNYTVSYWLRSSTPLTISGTVSGYPVTGRSYNGWTYYQHLITGVTTITVNGTAKIDELRFYPADAQMATYTYDPLTGITTHCDARNNISYYEYDDMNRLKNIKDMDDNILKSYDYRFAGVSVNYGAQLVYYNVAQSKVFQRNNCGSAYGTHVTYSVTAGLYSSVVSQQDADNQAIAYLNSTGPAYANTQGNCIVCSGEGRRIINEVCEDGERVNTKYSSGTCTYYYVFSDGTRSDDYTVSSTSTGCPIGIMH